MAELTDIVIGSGPAGVAAATALIARGRSVTMVDIGKRLEGDRSVIWKAAAQDWGTAEVPELQAPQFETPAGQARRFGSDFAMEPAHKVLARNPDGIGLRSSHALGGLSNLWGGATLPWREADLTGWPIGAAALEPHYRAVSRFMPVTRPEPAMADWLGYPGLTPSEPVPMGRQIAEVSRRMAGRSGKLRLFPAQQAVAPGCRQCGMCLHGCPWRLIWSAGQAVDTLRAAPGFTYRPDATVRAVASTAGGASVTLANGTVLNGRRVFVAAGVLETARLVFASASLDKLVLKDSSFAFLPLLHRWRARPTPDTLPYSTLPQAYAVLDNPRLSPFLINAQLYGWNEFFARDLIANYGARLPGSAPIWRALARRLIVAQVFLHSDHSHGIALSPSEDGRLNAVQMTNAATGDIMASAARAYADGFAKAGLVALRFALRHGQVGASFHLGGSLAMSDAPRGAQTDMLGQVPGLHRVHVVDASVLPSIAATTITMTVMANAHRIASEVD